MRIAKSYAAKMTRMLNAMRSDTGCAQLRRKANAAIASLKRQHLERQKAYDFREKKRIKNLI